MLRRTVKYMNSVFPENDNNYDTAVNMIKYVWTHLKDSSMTYIYGMLCFWIISLVYINSKINIYEVN